MMQIYDTSPLWTPQYAVKESSFLIVRGQPLNVLQGFLELCID